MNPVAVVGLWHLGCVTAAGLAERGVRVQGFDPDRHRIARLEAGRAPLFEPCLDDLLIKGLRRKRLAFSADSRKSMHGCRWIWLTADTPVGPDGNARVEELEPFIQAIETHGRHAKGLIISSQAPVGFAAGLERRLRRRFPGLRICCSPENLRLGKALDVFLNPDRIVIGIRRPQDRAIFQPLFQRLTARLEWMRTESAEMAKHAINGFLATSVTFTNELARVCEQVGASAFEVERALRSESRIGPRAYVRPGGAIAGGTLERDVHFLEDLCRRASLRAPLFSAVLRSNRLHAEWVYAQLRPRMRGGRKRLALLGLTYKEGTDTLRRSASLTLARSLTKHGVAIQAFDPQLSELPNSARRWMHWSPSAKAALSGASIAVIMSEHRAWRELAYSDFAGMKNGTVIDPNGVLRDRAMAWKGLRYVTIGAPERGLS